MKHLFTPWRFRYIAGQESRESGCVFCRARGGADEAAALVLHRTPDNIVMMNKYPYTSGHLMVAPVAHTASLADMGASARGGMMELVVACQRVLERAYGPHGFNVGMNLGEAAGAGIADHLHLHVVPRWRGDTNFMTSINDTRLVPEALEDCWNRLKPLFDGEIGGRP